MEPRFVVSNPNLSENAGKRAVERGPLVYCAEAADNGGRALDLARARAGEIRTERRPDLLGGVTVVQVGDTTLVPYYVWSHRGPGEMQVWLTAAAEARAATD